MQKRYFFFLYCLLCFSVMYGAAHFKYENEPWRDLMYVAKDNNFFEHMQYNEPFFNTVITKNRETTQYPFYAVYQDCIQRGFDENEVKNFFLLKAAQRGASNEVYWLLREKADPNVTDHFGVPALWFAVWNNDTATAINLLYYGADQHKMPRRAYLPLRQFSTLLQYALHRQNPFIVHSLLDYGARDINGEARRFLHQVRANAAQHDMRVRNNGHYHYVR